jgi:ABC-type nitrate/sulfonate/bicarbonate transport system substrate-binding protein
LFAREFLKLGGLTEKNVRIVTMPYPDMLAALKGKAIDLASAIDPGLYRAEQEGIAVRYKKLSQVMPGLNLGVTMYGERLITKDRDLGMRFMAAYQKANSYLRKRLTEPGGRKEIAQHVASGLVPHPPKLADIVDQSFAEAAWKGRNK